MSKLSFCLITLMLSVIACQHKKDSSLFSLRDDTGIDFQNTVIDNKDYNVFAFRNFYNGGGVAIGDVNNDSLPDVFLTANMGPNRLYINKGGFRFEDITEKAGFGQNNNWSTGAALVDINADGWLDIYVCNAGLNVGKGQANELFINNRDGSFSEKAAEFNLDDPSVTTHAAFFDYDLDGDLDCYLLNYSFIPVNRLNYSNKRQLRAKDWPVDENMKGGGDKLLQNENGKFVDVSQQAGIYGSLIGFGLGVTVGDVNGDHYPDIYICNDFFERDYLYINQKNGTFREELEERMQHASLSSMGADLADINNDDYPDLFVTDMLPFTDYRLKTNAMFDHIDLYNLKIKQGFYHQFMQNTLQLNNRSGNFLDVAWYAGVASTDWSWGGMIFDADNDGLNDLFICNGIYRDITDQDFTDFYADKIIQKMVFSGEPKAVINVIEKMPSVPISNKIYKNLGDLKFGDRSESWGLSAKSFSNGSAYGDLDNDGDLDLVINNLNQKASVYENHADRSGNHHYISLKLTGKGANTFAVGSKIKIYTAGQVLSRELIPTRGFQSSMDYKQTIGLGNMMPDSMLVLWPDLTETLILKPETNKTYVLHQTNSHPGTAAPPPTISPLLKRLPIALEAHQENEYNDFYLERLIPSMLSCEGPRAAVGDVDGNGLEDIVIGGAQGMATQLYLQSKNGFSKKIQRAFEEDKASEDTALQLFDCDGDGDLDLIAGSGGNNQQPGSELMQARLYLNEGKGQFLKSAGALPLTNYNIGAIAMNDVDGDGDVDMFIAGRNVTFNYGKTPSSYLFFNNGRGKFSDVSKKEGIVLQSLGMLTSATFADLNGDGNKELIVVGEWISPQVFEWRNNQMIPFKTNLVDMNGWWQTLVASDLDGDGDEDLVFGNYGENFYLKPDGQNPVKMFLQDFDKNSINDKMITRVVDGRDMPIFMKRDVQEQIPSLKKQNLKHADFAVKSINDLFPSEVLKQAEVKTIHTGTSFIAWNEGNGHFIMTPLPFMLQLSSINAVAASDLNGDNLTDLIVAGNFFQFLPQFSRLDASFGWVLLNKGNRQWTVLQQKQSGLFIRGAVRDLQKVSTSAGTGYLFLQNNDVPHIYEVANKRIL